MKKIKTIATVSFLSLLASSALAAEALTVTVKGIPEGGSIPPENAFCQVDEKTRTKDGGNKSPEISWTAGPEGTKSYALIMHDTDVPSVFDDANKEGKVIAESLGRKDFYHWVLIDIPTDITTLAAGADSDGVNKKGKPVGRQRYGIRGANDFGGFMNGTFGGYDGPCPPWNDERLHHYHFTVYALGTQSLNLSGVFSGPQALTAMEKHVLAKGSVTGTYTQNPKVVAAKGK